MKTAEPQTYAEKTIFRDARAFSILSVDDIGKAKGFYSETLGLEVAETPMGLELHIAGGNRIFVYKKNDHRPATFTILNFPVDDVESAVAVSEANTLIKEVMQARGYPVGDFEERAADLSVDHADVVSHYRAARDLATRNERGKASTEDLRQAVVHYRALFQELLEEPAAVAHAV